MGVRMEQREKRREEGRTERRGGAGEHWRREGRRQEGWALPVTGPGRGKQGDGLLASPSPDLGRAGNTWRPSCGKF